MNHQTPTPTVALRFQGFDISKATFDVARWGDQAFPAMALSCFSRTREGARAWLATLSPDEGGHTAVVMESTGGYSEELAVWLLEALPGLHVAIVNPFLVKSFGRSLALRNKTDRLDARLLARFGQDRQPAPWHPLPPTQAEVRALARTRAHLVHLRVSLGNRLGEHPGSSATARKAQQSVVKVLERQILALERNILKLAKKDEALGRDLALAQSVPGVGPTTAAVVLAEAGDLRRFNRRGDLAAFLGVSPRVHQSGTSVHGRTRMCRMGGSHARAALYMAAVAASRDRGPLGVFYRRLVAAGKPKRSALGALMRKLLLAMRAVLIQGRPYETRTSA
jgi:transposase